MQILKRRKERWGLGGGKTSRRKRWFSSPSNDANGNRASKTTTFGTIRYWYDAENRLVHSGSDRARGSDYTYDANGNLMSKKNLYKTEEYEYNLTNRMKKSVVTDQIKKTKTITHYDYDAFGRRTLVQDEGGKIIRTLYDAFSFDIIREQETFADGYFTNTRDTGIQWGKVSEGDGSRYRYIGDDAPAAKEQNGYSVTASNRASSRVALYANGQAVGVTRSSNYASSERSYFGTDLMGTVRSATTDSGNAEYYEYDVFGKPYGENVSDYAYTGKPYDPVTGMYNYGYRDYSPQTARFTTVDPIRDGSNWFVYCNNEPVNFRDLWGLAPGDIFQAIDEAANDFGTEYNGKSISENIEYGTTIIKKDDGYTYMEPTKGTVNSVTLPIPSNGPSEAVAGAHTHSAYSSVYNSNEFSTTDKNTAKEFGKPFYVATPNGTLKVYDPNEDLERIVNTNMPSDPNDPERKNNIDPKPNVPNETNNTEKATDIDSKKGK